MLPTNTQFPIFVRQFDVRLGGIFICDPKRLDSHLSGTSYGMDLLDFLTHKENLEKISPAGIGIPVVCYDSDAFTVVVRDASEKTYLKSAPRVISSGWVLYTEHGELLVTEFGSLKFWSPEEIDDEISQYAFVQVPSGWYRVEVVGGVNGPESEDEELDEFVLEFVLTPVGEPPNFSADLDHIEYRFEENEQRTKLQPGTSDVSAQNMPADVSNKEVLRLLLSRLNKNAFVSFVSELFGTTDEPFESLQEAGDDVFYQPLLDSYGGSLHRVFILQYSPLGLMDDPDFSALINDPLLPSRIQKVKEAYYRKSGYYGMVSPALVRMQKLQSLAFILNLNGLDPTKYQSDLFPKYADLLARMDCFQNKLLIGSYDSFLDLDAKGVDDAFKSFLVDNVDGVSIELSRNTQVSDFTFENSLTRGVVANRRQPYEPIYITRLEQKAQAILEFEELLKVNPKEEALEQFLKRYYKDIFGSNFDRIETQLWLRFPELDIVGKDRRLDIFLRNSVVNDWELFEIKRLVPLTQTYRDIPVLASEVSYAIQQIKNYERTLNQKSVRDKLAREGIEYFEPVLHLVVGRRPQISREQWRWLVASNGDKVRVLTFDDLVTEMKNRLEDKIQFLTGDE